MVTNAAIFRGDAEGFVDMLIAASRSKPVASPQLSALEGRELVPWTSDDGCGSAALLDMPLESSSNRRNSPQQHYGSKFPQRQARSTAAASAAAGGAAGKRGNNARAAGASGRRMSADHAPAARVAGFACPVVAASPKPEALPMPTGLMSRALVARSRSPSPPKDGFFPVMMAHVRPVAA